MKTYWPLLLIALLLHASAPPASAQTPAPTQASAAEAERAQEELVQKAVGLVGDALAEAQSLKLAENRLRAQATAARLLWPRDPKAARAAFKLAADGVAELNAAIDPEDPQFYNAAQTVGQFRVELINVAAPFDASLALDFLRATRPAYIETLVTAGYAQPSQEQSLEMTVTAYVALQEPQRALELAEEALSKGGVTMGLLNVLRQLSTKEPAAASKLAVALVRRLRPEDMRDQGEPAAVAQQLIQLTRPSGGQSDPGADSAGPLSGRRLVPAGGETPLLDEQVRRELVEKILTAFAGSSPNQGGGYNLFYAVQTLLPELDRLAPARAAVLRRRADEMERILNPGQQRMREYQQVMQTGTVEAVLEAARKAPADVRDQLYTNAAWRAYNNGEDPERARQILENIANPQQRAQVRRELEQRAQWRDVQQGGFAEARQAAARLKTPEERVQALIQLANRAATTPGNAETARLTLEEARSIVESQTRGQQQFSYRLQITQAYVQLDPDEAFEMLEAAVGRLDALIDAAEVVDGFGMDSFREGELRAQNGYIWNEMVSQVAQVLASLARTDFERAAAAAKKFRRPEARTNAELVLAQSLLGTYAKPEFRGRTRAGISVITK